jgi:uncharacterized membrane protein YkgB
MLDQNQSRRRSKVLGFIIAESVAVGILVLAGTFALLAGPVGSTATIALNVVLFGAAGGVAVIPILFFALAPTLPRPRR